MDLLIPDNWLREFLITKASPKEIAKYVSLCGPSFERVSKTKYGTVYSIEVTTNRVDSASVLGIAREASAILPRFKIAAKFVEPKPKSKQKTTKSAAYLKAIVDPKLCFRFAAVLIENVKISQSPSEISKKLIGSGIRPINNIVDISNYIMLLFGQPVHTFDYDKIQNAKMVLRASFPGEKLTTLDGKTHRLPGGDIVVEDGSKKLIDLAGIMGGENSMVDEKTENILLFVQTYNPVNIRKTSMTLAAGTQACMLFEKGLDTEMVEPAIRSAIDMFVNLTGGEPAEEILDIYPHPFKVKSVHTNIDLINQRIGVALSKEQISNTLLPLGFYPRWSGKNISVEIPSYRKDVSIPEDIIEEVARIYGYHNLPGKLLSGEIPQALKNPLFAFEEKIKDFLSGWGGVEVYTSSLVSKEEAGNNALKLKNPLGKEAEYLRTSLMSSLLRAAEKNSGITEPFHLFEIANVYLPQKNNLPQEQMTLAGIFADYSYKAAKGIVEALLEKLNINYKFIPEDLRGFLPSQRLSIKSGQIELGQFGVTESGPIYYEFPMKNLQNYSDDFHSFKPVPKFPAQIEDITLTFPPKTKTGEVVQSIKSADKLISNTELTDIYKDSYTFKVWYQHPSKTLTDKEVEAIREKIIKGLKSKFGGILKSG